MKAKDLDKKFDEGQDISEYLDVSKIRRPKHEQKRMIIKLWVAERLEKISRNRNQHNYIIS